MNRKLVRGVIILFAVLGVVGMFVFIGHNLEERKRLKKEIADAQSFWWKTEQESAEVPQSAVSESHPSTPHFHADGTLHEAPDAPIEVSPSRDFTPTQVQIPEGITSPDVLAAWERLDYIANNIWEWGGVPSQRALELIDQLMPPPDGFSGSTGHADLEETIDLLGELAWSGDPRAAAVVATYLCEGIIGGNDPIDALVDMGPPAVPYLVPYLLDENTIAPSRAVEPLGRIAEKHREDLGGIVEHIIIPRLEYIAAIPDPPTRMVYTKVLAQESLDHLK